MSDKQHKPEERTEENLEEAREKILREAREEILAEAREEILAEAREEARKKAREEIAEEVNSFLKRLWNIDGIHEPNSEVSIAQVLFVLRAFVDSLIRMPQLKAELKAKYRDQA